MSDIEIPAAAAGADELVIEGDAVFQAKVRKALLGGERRSLETRSKDPDREILFVRNIDTRELAAEIEGIIKRDPAKAAALAELLGKPPAEAGKPIARRFLPWGLAAAIMAAAAAWWRYRHGSLHRPTYFGPVPSQSP